VDTGFYGLCSKVLGNNALGDIIHVIRNRSLRIRFLNQSLSNVHRERNGQGQGGGRYWICEGDKVFSKAGEDGFVQGLVTWAGIATVTFVEVYVSTAQGTGLPPRGRLRGG
jgi:hypothetical protein